jgi:hypothetical protein
LISSLMVWKEYLIGWFCIPSWMSYPSTLCYFWSVFFIPVLVLVPEPLMHSIFFRCCSYALLCRK